MEYTVPITRCSIFLNNSIMTSLQYCYFAFYPFTLTLWLNSPVTMYLQVQLELYPFCKIDGFESYGGLLWHRILVIDILVAILCVPAKPLSTSYPCTDENKNLNLSASFGSSRAMERHRRVYIFEVMLLGNVPMFCS